MTLFARFAALADSSLLTLRFRPASSVLAIVLAGAPAGASSFSATISIAGGGGWHAQSTRYALRFAAGCSRFRA